jgi:hypothetical protein
MVLSSDVVALLTVARLGLKGLGHQFCKYHLLLMNYIVITFTDI